MGEGKTNMFGKTYNTIGSTDSNFIIKTKGDLKVQWGGKFIDVIKNGKLASAGADILKVASSSDDISSNGVYLVPTDEGNEVWVSIDGTKVNISNEGGDSYVSFLTDQEEITSDQKYRALTNIGFYYDTLDEAKSQDIKAGIVFVVQENKFYVSVNGELQEYKTSQTISQDTNFDEITIGQLRIYSQDSTSYINSKEHLEITINDIPYILLNSDGIVTKKNLIIGSGNYIQSEGATDSSGFRIYMSGNKSIIEADSIIERDLKNVLENQTIYSSISNIVTSASFQSEGEVLLELRYENQFQQGQNVYVQSSENIEDEEDNSKQITSTNIYEVLYADDSSITIGAQDVPNCVGHYIYLADEVVIKMEGNSMNILENGVIHSKIGEVKEQDFSEQLENCQESQEVSAGIYSDNFIGLNSKLYDSVFKKRCDYPKYDESVEIPEDFQDEKYNKAVPNVEWIRELIKLAVPSGTIAMYNGRSEIPEGWAICDGNNGTPNLVGKFIKAVSTIDQIGDNESELNENNEFIITQEHLPKHSHPHKSHTHNLGGNLSGTTGSSGNLTVSLNYSDYNWGIESVQKEFVTSVTGEGITSETGTVDGVSNIRTQGGNATGGNHTHSISLDAEGGLSLSSSTSKEETLEDSEWPNKPLKIEPRSYSLVFIMKL